MINFDEVSILIFDLDGTISQSDKATFLVMKKAFTDLGIKKSLTEQDVRKNLGEPSGRFFKNLLGLDYASRWEEVAGKYDPMIPEFATAFPGAIETLDTLKKRGYKLVLCSNCGKKYFDATLFKLNIGQYFDYTECHGENNLSKSEMVRKIINKFSGLKAAVIGDKIHDIEAARENNALSVGALYGYGYNESKKADMTINNFSELLNIFHGPK